MKKIVVVLALVLVASILSPKMAVHAEEAFKYVCWTTDTNNRYMKDIQLFADRYETPKQRILHRFDLASKEYQQYSIPTYVKLLDADVPGGVVYYLESRNTGGRHHIEILRWSDGKDRQICTIYLPGYDNVLAYYDGYVYYEINEYGRDNSIESKQLVRINAVGSMYNYGQFPSNTKFSISHNGSVMAITHTIEDQGEDSYFLEDKVSFEFHILDANGRHERINVPSEIDAAPLMDKYDWLQNCSWLDQNRFLFWASLKDAEVPSVVLYDYDDGYVNVPRYYEKHLLCYDLTQKTITPYRDQNGELVREINRGIYETATPLGPDMLLYFRHTIHPLDQVDYEDYSGFYTDEMVLLTLGTGERQILYQCGYELVDSEKLWEYAIGKHNEKESDLSELKEILLNVSRIDNGQGEGEAIHFASFSAAGY